jgi:hypothetical protein
MEFQGFSGAIELEPGQFHHATLLRKRLALFDGGSESDHVFGELGKRPSQI